MNLDNFSKAGSKMASETSCDCSFLYLFLYVLLISIITFSIFRLNTIETVSSDMYYKLYECTTYVK